MTADREIEELKEQLLHLAPDKEEGMKVIAKLNRLLLVSGRLKELLAIVTEAVEAARANENDYSLSVLLQISGSCYKMMGDFTTAMQVYYEGLAIAERKDYKETQARILYSMTDLITGTGNYNLAIEYSEKAGKLYKETNDTEGMVLTELGILIPLLKLKRHEQFTMLATRLQNELDNYTGIPVNRRTDFKGFLQMLFSEFYAQKSDLENSYLCLIKALELFESINDFRAPMVRVNIGALMVELGKTEESIAWLSDTSLDNCPLVPVQMNRYDYLSRAYESLNDFANAFKYHKLFHTKNEEMKIEDMKRQVDAASYKKEIEAERSRKEEVEREKKRADDLLHNILPEEVAHELKEKGNAEAKLFENVTVFFSDFKGFTTVSEKLSPQELVNELHECFTAFDNIMHKYNIEKIKTVGDAYLAVSGLPLANPNHAEDMVKAAIEIREFMLQRRKEHGDKTFEIRIGVHSGSVVAGIVGVKKFAYDIWGDTVNTAARMEQNGEAGKINISQTTYELVKDKFNCEYRGEIEAKNKGKLKMYFVK